MRSSIQSTKTRLGADCGSDHELLIGKFILKLKKIKKTTRPFRYDVSQIPYDFTVEVRSRFKGLDLIDRMPEGLWTEVHDIVQEAGIKTIPMEKKCKQTKWLSEEALQIAEKRRVHVIISRTLNSLPRKKKKPVLCSFTQFISQSPGKKHMAHSNL